MKLIIDEREHDLFNKCSLLMEQTPYPNVYLSKEVLHIGDMIVRTNSDEDILIIERKTFADLLASIKDGRYEEQSYRLLYSSGFRQHSVIYLLEGMFSMLKFPNDKKIVYSAITSLNFFKGFSTHRTATIQETAEWVLHMTEKIGKELLNGKQPYYTLMPSQAQAKEPNQEDGGGVAAQETPADYCSVVKKVKKENITPDNIGEIMLCQIPGISTATAVAIMKRFDGGFPHFLDNLQNNSNCLENIVMEMDNGKQRKISKSSVENIRRFLLSATPPLKQSTPTHQEKEPCLL